MPAEHFHPQVHFKCPFCGRQCSAGFTLPPGAVEENPAVIHMKPTCPKFDDLEPDDYLHEVNIRYGAHN
jgi:hypothetical protein